MNKPPRTLTEAMSNAQRLRREIPQLVQPSNTDYDMVVLANEIDRLKRIIKQAYVAIQYDI